MSSALHGWTGILMGYAAVQGPMIAGLMRARASFQQYVSSPMVAAPLTAVAAVAAATCGFAATLASTCSVDGSRVSK